MEAQPEYVHVARTFFARSAPICYAQSVLINKVSASEVSRKFTKSALLVGYSAPYGRKLFLFFFFPLARIWSSTVAAPSSPGRRGEEVFPNNTQDREILVQLRT